MKPAQWLLLIFLLSNPVFVYSQPTTQKEFIRLVQEADMYFYFYEDYEKASVLYNELRIKHPDNNNLSAKLAICFLQTENRQHDAIPLLLHASKNIAKHDNEYTEFGDKAPVETLFYLAHAYHVSDSLEKAIELYTDLRNRVTDDGLFRTDYIEMQIRACKHAMEVIRNPVPTHKELFVPFLADFPGATNPVVSANDSVFLFTHKRDGTVTVFCSYNNEGWSYPEDITMHFGNTPELYTNSITADGSLLVVYVFTGDGGNLHYSQREGNRWSKLRKFPKPVNSKYWEAHGFITPDGNRLFFASNRPGGIGELDIYISDRTEKGGWSDPVNAGRSINTKYNETSPFYNPETATLFFSSEGHKGIGGYDIFQSTLINGKWSIPVMIPYPVNTTGHNRYIAIPPDGNGFLIASGDRSFPEGNINKVKITETYSSGEFIIKGKITTDDAIPLNYSQIAINFTEKDSKTSKIVPDAMNTFTINVMPGEYRLTVTAPGYNSDSLHIRIDEGHPYKEIISDIILMPEKVVSGEFLTIRSVLFGFDSNLLTKETKEELDHLCHMLSGEKELTVEISGYTDSKGTDEYNLRLAKLRAEAVADYMSTLTGNKINYVTRAAGAAGFVAINRNPDGSDNPEGRAFNRRVAIGVVNPGTGVTLSPVHFIPSHLRHPQAERYGILLFSSADKYYPDYFSSLGTTEMYFVRPVREDSVYSYIMGDFNDRIVAARYLKSVNESGFTDARIISLYELNSEEPTIYAGRISQPAHTSLPVYTIQLFAGMKQDDHSLFRGIAVTELEGNDGLFRYVTGEFQGFSAAQKELIKIRKSGFSDAFIRDFKILMSQRK